MTPSTGSVDVSSSTFLIPLFVTLLLLLVVAAPDLLARFFTGPILALRRRAYVTMPEDTPATCVVCSGPSSKVCASCKSARYCSRKCQTVHWKDGHKLHCKGITNSPASKDKGFILTNHFSPRKTKEAPTKESINSLTNPVRVLPHSKVLFSYEDFVKFYHWDKFDLAPCGLLNCGNSCFANVVLQCLACTRPLVAFLLESHHMEQCVRDDWCFLCELCKHVQRVVHGRTSFAPLEILSRISKMGGSLGYGRQEDAHEFMRVAIDSMQSICLDEFGGEKALDSFTRETSVIFHIFGGHLQSQVQCTQCRRVSKTVESMLDLTVDISGDVSCLEDALEQFTAVEWLDGDNRYKCEGCNAYVKACKRLTVLRAPNILTITLKRYKGGKFGKLKKDVTFPETLDFSPYVSGDESELHVYKLYAVVVHLDMLNASFFGHYICYVKDLHGTWYKVDDDKVTKVKLEEVLSQNAYMLLYSRLSARPPLTITQSATCVPKDTSRIGITAMQVPSSSLSTVADECLSSPFEVVNSFKSNIGNTLERYGEASSICDNLNDIHGKRIMDNGDPILGALDLAGASFSNHISLLKDSEFKTQAEAKLEESQTEAVEEEQRRETSVSIHDYKKTNSSVNGYSSFSLHGNQSSDSLVHDGSDTVFSDNDEKLNYSQKVSPVIKIADALIQGYENTASVNMCEQDLLDISQLPTSSADLDLLPMPEKIEKNSLSLLDVSDASDKIMVNAPVLHYNSEATKLQAESDKSSYTYMPDIEMRSAETEAKKTDDVSRYSSQSAALDGALMLVKEDDKFASGKQNGLIDGTKEDLKVPNSLGASSLSKSHSSSNSGCNGKKMLIETKRVSKPRAIFAPGFLNRCSDRLETPKLSSNGESISSHQSDARQERDSGNSPGADLCKMDCDPQDYGNSNEGDLCRMDCDPPELANGNSSHVVTVDLGYTNANSSFKASVADSLPGSSSSTRTSCEDISVSATINRKETVSQSSIVSERNIGKPLFAPGFLIKSPILNEANQSKLSCNGSREQVSEDIASSLSCDVRNNLSSSFDTTREKMDSGRSENSSYVDRDDMILNKNASYTESNLCENGIPDKSVIRVKTLTGKKQGRNESCQCGSQQKWKKCCGKSDMMINVPIK